MVAGSRIEFETLEDYVNPTLYPIMTTEEARKNTGPPKTTETIQSTVSVVAGSKTEFETLEDYVNPTLYPIITTEEAPQSLLCGSGIRN